VSFVGGRRETGKPVSGDSTPRRPPPQAAELEGAGACRPKHDDHRETGLTRARALLAQPVAEEPTDEELLRLAREWNSGFESIELHFAADYARAVLARWGHPTPQPANALPTPEAQ
jgi:hypothetical protein